MNTKQKIVSAFQRFALNDFHLLRVNASERSMTHKLAEYLQMEFPEYHVDCEYNRNSVDKKRISIWEQRLDGLLADLDHADVNGSRERARRKILAGEVSVYPDIIVHRRGTDDNFIVIEAKKSTNYDGDDRDKLIEYKRCLGYRSAYFIKFPIGMSECDLTEEFIYSIVEEIGVG